MPDADPTADPEVFALAQRCVLALKGFALLNSAPGDAAYAPSETWQVGCALTAIEQVLIRAGLTTERELLIMTLTLQAENLEGTLKVAAEDLREKTGFIVPGVFPLNARQQG